MPAFLCLESKAIRIRSLHGSGYIEKMEARASGNELQAMIAPAAPVVLSEVGWMNQARFRHNESFAPGKQITPA